MKCFSDVYHRVVRPAQISANMAPKNALINRTNAPQPGSNCCS